MPIGGGGGPRESQGGVADAMLAAPAESGGGPRQPGGVRPPRRPMPTLSSLLARNPGAQADGSEGVTTVEKEALLSEEDTAPGGLAAAVSGEAMVNIAVAETGNETNSALNRIRNTERFGLLIHTYLDAFNSNDRLPLGREGFMNKFIAWRALVEQISEPLTVDDKRALAKVVEAIYYQNAIGRMKRMIDRQILDLKDDEEPKTCPVWFLYDLLKRLAVGADNLQMVGLLEEHWEVIQFVHAKQIARVDAPFVAAAVQQSFPDDGEITILNVGTRTGDDLAETLRLLGTYKETVDKRFKPTAIDLHPRNLLAEKFSNAPEFNGIPPVTPVGVLQGNILHLSEMQLPRQKVICAWNILHKLTGGGNALADENQHAQAIKEMAKLQEEDDVLILHMPYFNDKPGSDDRAALSQGIFEGIDTGNGAIKSTEYWKKVLRENGYLVVEVNDVGTKTGNLDSFPHQVFSCRRCVKKTS